MIAQETIESAKAVSLVEILQTKGIEVEKRGNQCFARCPFHDDKKPSLSIDLSNNLFKCFGCGVAGDAIRFIELLENKSFPKAVSSLVSQTNNTNGKVELAGKKGILPQKVLPQQNDNQDLEGINPQELLNRVTEFYHATLLREEAPQKYLTKRGLIGPELYHRFKIGYSGGSLLAALPKGGPVIKTLQTIGVLNSNGKELFYGCVTVPLLDADGNTVGMYGRRITNRGNTQHLYLPGKRRGLVNRQAALTADSVILTESIIDALTLYQHGFVNAMPLYGTNGLTDDHLELFYETRPKSILICMDNDNAGKKGAEEYAQYLLSQGYLTRVIEVPRVKDINEFFVQGGEAKEFSRLLNPDQTTSKKEGNYEETASGLIVTFEDRQYRIRGISNIGIDKLRVNIKATYNGRYHLDTLDLYQSKSRKYFIMSVVKQLGLSQEVVDKDILRLIEVIEAYQSRHNASEEEQEQRGKELTEEEKVEGLALLKDPNLLNIILSDLETLGHVGEETNKILAYLIAVSRKLPKPLSGIVISGAGAGKSGLIEAIQELVPPEEVEFFSRITPQALYYMDRDALRHKLLIIEERSGGEGADYSIRTLQSRRKLTQAVPIKDPNTGKIRTMTFEVEGPIAYLETTTNPEINHENATRCFELYLDESPAQTRRIHEAQRSAKTEDGLKDKLKSEEIKVRHRNMQRLLEPVMIEIPYASILDFPADSLRTRRDHERFLSLIEAATFLFQHQRQRKEITLSDNEKVTIIMSTEADYAIAYKLSRDILGFTLDDLKKHPRELLELIQEMVEAICQASSDSPEEISFTRREIREYTSWPDHQVKAYIKQLEELEYLRVDVKSRGQYFYQLNNPNQRRPLKGLLTPEELQSKLASKKALK